MKVLLCERCQLIHSESYDGLTCRNPDCQGKLIPVEIDFSLVEGNGGEPDDDQPEIAS